MRMIPPTGPIRLLISVLLVVLTAAGLGWLGQDWWPAFCWVAGQVLASWSLVNLYPQRAATRSWPVVLHALLGAAGFVLLLLLLQHTTSKDLGWRGFLHLSDLPARAWVNLLALLAPVLGCWLLGVWQIQKIHERMPDRGRRALLLGGTALGVGALAWGIGAGTNYLPLALSLAVFLFSIDIYLDSNRTSMTWLLLWLLLVSSFVGAYAFQQSLRIDQQAQQDIALDIVRQGVPDTIRQYHLAFQWDTLSPTTARERLRTVELDLPAGVGLQRVSDGRTDWVYHRADEQGYVIVGRPSGGFRPPLALTSLFFLTGLVYVFLLRALCWLLGYPYQRWLLPLFGPSSLRIRIQAAFFALILVAFLLVGWFTVNFFKDQPQLLNTWLEQLLSLYVFLLVIAGALGILLANSITEPIVRIGQKLGTTRLQDNQPLTWPRDDEIGRLVRNYNQMILDLDASAAKLAANERESAWREMAKQVAHEIKNPLTPMKLQLQQLLRLKKEDPERALSWSSKVAKTMIEQIDGLALIATEFSHFARLPQAQASAFDGFDLVRSAYELHRSANNGLDFELSLQGTTGPVFADRDQLVRVFNNLLRNAIQALDGHPTGRIELAAEATPTQVILTVRNNGPGIPAAIRDRIFQPNFTTKSAGMGLGLAMCKNIVEQAGGTIDFTTETGLGTAFRVVLPLAVG